MPQEEMKQLKNELKAYMKELVDGLQDDCDLKYMTKEEGSTMKEGFLERLSNYVKFSTFTWVIGVLMVIVLGLFGVIYGKMEMIDSNTQDAQIELSELNGRLAPFDFVTEDYE